MIGDPAKLVIKRPGERPAAAVVAPFAARSTSFIVDALEGRGALDHRIKPLDPKGRFAGVALTARAGARDNLAAIAALDLIQPGDVLVIAAQGFTETAVLGDNMARIAKQRGAVAVVTDGAVRDVDEIRTIGLPVFSRAVTPNSAFPSGPGEVGLPLALGDIPISTGDLVIGDADGVVVVPSARIAEITEALGEVARRETELQAKIEGGGFDTLLSAEISRSIRYVE
ncbi:MAG: RraA family protein [Alphaproteobacteria bacterium]|nr:RraA family protein [Alphaproteobacteria bacterium]